MDAFSLLVEFNGQVRSFLLDGGATLGEVEAVVTNGFGITLNQGSKTQISSHLGEPLVGNSASLFLTLSPTLMAVLSDPVNQKTLKVGLSHTDGGNVTSSASTLASIDEVLNMANTADFSLPSGDEFLNDFDNLLGDMNKAISESEAGQLTAQAQTGQTTDASASTGNAALLAEFAQIEEQQAGNKKKTMRTRDLNAFLEAEFAGIAGIGEPAAPVVTDEALAAQQQQELLLQQQQAAAAAAAAQQVVVTPPSPRAQPTSSTSPTQDRSADSEESALSVSQRAEMARTIQQAKSVEAPAQRVKMTAVSTTKKATKDKEKKEKKEKKDKKGKDKNRMVTMDEDFSSVANPAYESTDRAGVNPLFLNTAGAHTQAHTEHGGYVSPLASAVSPRSGSSTNSSAQASPRVAGPIGAVSPRQGSNSPVSARSGAASPPRTAAVQTVQPAYGTATVQSVQTSHATATVTTTSAGTTQTSAPAAGGSGAASSRASGAFTRAARPTGNRVMRRENTIIGTRASQMFSPAELQQALVTSSEAPAALGSSSTSSTAATQTAPVQTTTAVAPPATVQETTPAPAVQTPVAATPTAETPAQEAQVTPAVVAAEPAPQATAVAPSQANATPAAPSAQPEAPKPAEPEVSKPEAALTPDEILLRESQQQLLAQQKALEEERARIDRENAERFAQLEAQRKALEDQRAAMLAAHEQALKDQQAAAAATEQARLQAEQQAIAAEKARLEAANEQARIEAEKAEAAKAEAAKAEAARVAAENARLEAEKAEQARIEAEKKEQARIEAEKAEQARAAALAAEQAAAAEKARLEAEKAAAAAQVAAAPANPATPATMSTMPPAPSMGTQELPTFVSQSPATNYPDPTSISAMLHEQLDQLLLETPGSASVPAASPVAPIQSNPAPVAAPSNPAPEPTKEDPSQADEMDQLLAALDRPYLTPQAGSSAGNNGSEAKITPDPVPDLREPGPKPEEPPPSHHENPSSTPSPTPELSHETSPSSLVASSDSAISLPAKPRRKKKKKRTVLSEDSPTGTFSAVRKRKKKRRIQQNAESTGDDVANSVASSDNQSSAPSSAKTDSDVVIAPIKPPRRNESDSESDSDEGEDDDSSGGGSVSRSKITPPSSVKSTVQSPSSLKMSSGATLSGNRDGNPTRATIAADGIASQPPQLSTSGKSLTASSMKLESRPSARDLDSKSLASSSQQVPKKKFKRARKRNFDEEMAHRRRMNYTQDSDSSDDEEREMLDTGYIFKQARPSSAFRFAEKDELMWFHLSLHRMSMMRQAPFWLTQPAVLASERNRYKLANAAVYPYGTPAVEDSDTIKTTLNVLFHLGDPNCGPANPVTASNSGANNPRNSFAVGASMSSSSLASQVLYQAKLRTLLQCNGDMTIQELKELAFNQFEILVKESQLDPKGLRIIDEYVVQMTDTPIFILEEATTLSQLMVSASWMHVEQFTLVDRHVYELTKLKATNVSKMMEIDLPSGSGPAALPSAADRVTTLFGSFSGGSVSSKNGNATLSTPTWQPSDSEEMHFRKNASRNTIVLVKKTIQQAAVTTAPIPPYISSKVLTTIHFKPGSSSMIAAGPNSTIAELLEDAKKKFFIQPSQALVLKICGRREYVISHNLPLHRLEYVRKQLERKRKIQFQLINAETIGCVVDEASKTIKVPWESETKIRAASPSLEHPLSPRNHRASSGSPWQARSPALSATRSTHAERTKSTNVSRTMSVSAMSKMIAMSDASQVETPQERAKRLRLAKRRASLYYPTTMPFSIPSWLVKQAFELKVCSAEALVLGDSMKNCNVFQMSFFVEVGLFFGGEPITKSETTSSIPWSDSLTWDQVIVFSSLCLGDIPKETRVCLTLYARDKSGNTPMGWASHRLFDFHDVLASGPITTYMWPEEAANPIGFCGSCASTKEKNTHRLKFEFESHAVPVTYTDIMELPRSQEVLTPPTPNESQKADIEEVALMDPLFYPNNRERELMWRFRHWIKDNHPKALNKLALAVPWTDPLQIQEFYRLLEIWPKIEPQNALELLDARYANERVREYAVVCLEALSDSKLLSFMLQLVQVLKYEVHHYSVLAQFLLDRALENEMMIGQRLFWFLRAELHVPETRERFGLLLESLLLLCSDQLQEQLQQQITVIGILQDCALKVKTYPGGKRTETIRRMLSEVKFPAAFTLPLDPSQELSGNLDISKCRCFDSAKAPILLCFRSADPCIEKEQDNFVMFKAGDDLRQDALTLQMLTLMDQMWKQAGLDLHMTPYLVAVTGDGTGLIEVVPDSMTTAKIQRENGGSLAAFSEKPLSNWLKTANPAENDLSAAVDNFVLSCAGYCVATYVLGIGDRHNDNIMVDRKGHFFHIDFGHFLGNYKSWAGIWDREKAPFVFTPEFAFVMDGKDSDKFNYFVRQCQRAYNIVRQQGNFILNLFIMMLSTGIPELRSAADLLYLQDALASHLTDSEAGDFFNKLIDSSLNSTTTRLNAFFHLLAH